MPASMGHLGNCSHVRDVKVKVADGFDVNHVRLVINCCVDGLWILAFNKLAFDVKFLHVNSKLMGSAG
jgi:hypothetical protein